MSEKLWSPTHETVRSSLLSQFTNEVADQGAGSFDDYDALHQWSVENPADFWAAYWDFAELKASQKGDIAVKDLDRFPGASWFPEAKLNYAENLLSNRSSKTAFVSILENGERKSISYEELYLETNNLQSFLRAHISIGDRVAGWLPNTIETVVAMLATSSLGGVWSSCSPDFGIEGALDRFGQIEPKVLFACDGYFYAGKTIDIKEKVRSVVEQVKSIELTVWVSVLEDTQAAQSKETNWGHWPSALSPAINFEQLAFDHPLYIMYSSGTTGKPKCIVHGQGGTLIQHKKEHQLHLDLRADDNLFFFTTCGWMMWNWLVSALATGCTITLYDGSPFHPKPDVLFDLIDQESITVFGVSAKFLSNAQKEMVSPVESHQLNSLRCLISTGSPLTEEGFEYVYEKIKQELHLVSMTGGTDLISCFILGNPNLPVYSGELQSPGLGMAVDIWDDNGNSIKEDKGELVCTVPFPSCPIRFWNDPDNNSFLDAYFRRFPNIWVHGDFGEITPNGGYIIHGRSDAVLNPGGVRIGTAEIYRQVEVFDEVVDSVCIGQSWDGDVRVVLFVVMREGVQLSVDLIDQIKLRIRNHASPRHVPAKVIAVADIPRTMSGKIAELAVRDKVHGREVKNTAALANPESLSLFENLVNLID
tara:strand:- start:316 stop:2256 length:1941 start_codon:yes stop_codon:yes gene_type:complete